MAKPITLRILLLVTIFCINTITAYAQTSEELATTDTALAESAMNVYHHALSPENNLYNGREYAYNTYYPFIINEGHPFFISKDFTNGDVFYNGILFKDVPLLFDIVHEELLIRNPGKQYIITLNNENIRWFNLWDQKFVRLVKDTSEKNVSTGFYDVLHAGTTSLYKKVIKELKENTASATGLNKYIAESDKYFILKDNRYFEVKNKKSVLLILNDKKKEVSQFIHKNRLNVRKQKDDALTKIVVYYNTLHA